MSTRVITFHYTMSDPTGEVIYDSNGKDPIAYLEGMSQIFPGLESVLSEMNAGEKRHVELPAAQAFGEYDDDQVFTVPRDQMPDQPIAVGDQFQSNQHDGPLTVTEVTDDEVTMDANHPLAGQDLVFDVEVVEIREATEEEVAHGHVHGAGGHHH